MATNEHELPLLSDSDEHLATTTTSHPAPTPTHPQRNNNHHRLYLSHTLSTLNTRVFEFGSTLYLASIFPSTLLPMSIYALTRGLAAVLLSPSIGRYIDSAPRLQVVRQSIVYQRLAVAVSCAMLYFMASGMAHERWVSYVLLAALSIIACVEKLCAVMNLVAVERDWVVVVAGEEEGNLRRLNSVMRRIDLACKLVGPFLISVVDGWDTKGAILVNLGMGLVALPVEWFAIRWVYDSTPELQRPKGDGGVSTLVRTWGEGAAQLREQLWAYATHRTMLPSLAGALLYLTVLSFSGQMVTFLLSIGFTSTTIALLRTLSVGFELSATFLAPRAISSIGPIRSGIWFLSWQMLCLAVGVTFFNFLHDALMAAIMLVAGTILSRVGLWGFDLSAQMIVQEEVEAELRGSFSAVEASLQNCFELVSFVMTIVWSRPQDFGWPVMGSCCAVYTAGVLYAWFVRRRRGHLVHFCGDGSFGGSRKGRVLRHTEQGGAIELDAESLRVVPS